MMTMKMCVYVSAGLLFFMCVCLNEQMLEACSCYPAHPQQLFCYADVVFKATVLSKKLIPDKSSMYPGHGDFKYKINITKVYKGFEHAGIKHFFSPEDDGMCGISLTPGVYLLSGNLVSRHIGHVKKSLTVELCDIVSHWSTLSKTEKKILSVHRKACNCQVTRCYKEPCDENKCYLRDTYDPDEDSQSICMANSTGSCRWTNAY
ncbi:metalloproteinase inhibitor 4.3 [Danio aesculapii]|uniref:metalloproteinase inhibitor 4.3 n=1 Tax=Danio aesculapii TaxID=1142201 RepID=UPI0024C07F4A|nr:metalloproteinase inhibitor 4.3 [Danio aesculapii]